MELLNLIVPLAALAAFPALVWAMGERYFLLAAAAGMVAGALFVEFLPKGSSIDFLWAGGLILTAIALFAFFWRHFSFDSLRQRRRKESLYQEKTQTLEKLDEKISSLKENINKQENRLQASWALYNTARDLAECVGFEQMKRILERDLPKIMPLAAGFAVYLRGAGAGAFEPKLRQRLWLPGEKEPGQIELFFAGIEAPAFKQDAAQKNYLVLPVLAPGNFSAYFIAALTEEPANKGARLPKQEMLELAAMFGEELKLGLIKTFHFTQVQRLSQIDGLTGVFRRGVFDTKIIEELVRARGFKTKLGLMILDIDHFKSLNDQWGHPFGDMVLKRVSGIIAASVYETDCVARYGGEEFAVLLPRANEEGAARKAQSIRERIENEVFIEPKGTEVHGTISIGLAFYPRDALDGAGLIRAADQALYYAKNTGRNKVVNFVSFRQEE